MVKAQFQILWFSFRFVFMIRLHLTCNVYLYFCKRKYLVTTEIVRFSKLGNIMFTGDLNARTGDLPDFNEYDSKAFVPLPTVYIPDFNWLRCNTDCTVNSYGKELLNLCVSSNLRIVNGRIGRAKAVGASTCFTPRGSSLVDYFVTSIHFFELFLTS